MRTITINCFAALLASWTIIIATAAAPTAKAAPDPSVNDALGVYSGPFGPNTITLRLERVDGKTAVGYSEMGKNRRPFSGSVTVRGGTPHFEVREPGDNPEDGVFRFQYSPDQQTLAGTWTPNNKKLQIVNFRLSKTGNTAASAETSAARGGASKTAAQSGHTDGTLVIIETRGAHTYFVLKDDQGQQHSFAAINPDESQLTYLAWPENYYGQRMRIHWESAASQQTGETLKGILEISKAGSRMYVPAKGSAERNAIIEAVTADYERRYKKRVTIDAEVLRVENGWAGVSGTANEPGQTGPGGIWVAILRGSGTKWKVVGTSAGDEKAQGRGKENDRPHWDEHDRLRKEYPNAPVSVLGLLDYP